MNTIAKLAFAAGVTAAMLCTSACTAPDTGEVSAPAILTDNPAPEFTAEKFIDLGGAGEPQSYEELQDFIKPYDSVNLLGFEIVNRYTPQDAFKLTNDAIYNDSATLYDIRVTYDYLGGAPLDIAAKLNSPGTPDQQFEGTPPFAVGSTYVGFLPSFAADEINYTFSELLFAADGTSAYQMDSDKFAFADENGNNIADEGFTAQSVITTTTNNPVLYTNRISIDALARFFKTDWTARGYAFQTGIGE